MTDPTKTTSWRDLIKVHPAAEMFPLMAPEELQTLAEDIKTHGLTDPVTTWVDKDGTEWLLDGRNRLDAMVAAGYHFKLHGQVIGLGSGDHKRREPERFKILPRAGAKPCVTHVKNYFGDDPYAYVVSANIHRRHLTTDQRKTIAEELLKANPARSDRSIAEEVGVSHPTVAAIRDQVEASTGKSFQLAPDQPEPEPPKRVGRDGKARKMPAGRKRGKAETADEQIEALKQRKARKKAATKASEQSGEPASTAEPARERATTPALSDDEQFAFRQGHPTVEKSSRDINRAFKRCSHEERQFLCGYLLPAVLQWFDLEDVAPALFAAEPIEIPPNADLDQFATMFARLTISQQNDVIDRADSLRDAGRLQVEVEATEAAAAD